MNPKNKGKNENNDHTHTHTHTQSDFFSELGMTPVLQDAARVKVQPTAAPDPVASEKYNLESLLDMQVCVCV